MLSAIANLEAGLSDAFETGLLLSRDLGRCPSRDGVLSRDLPSLEGRRSLELGRLRDRDRDRDLDLVLVGCLAFGSSFATLGSLEFFGGDALAEPFPDPREESVGSPSQCIEGGGKGV